MAAGGVEFEIQVTREGRVVGSRPASLGACVEDALFAAVVAGRIPNDGSLPDFALSPESDGATPSAVAALVLRAAGAPAVRYEADVVASQARSFIRGLRADGAIEPAAEVGWRLAARAADAAPPRFSARVMRAPLPLAPARLESAAAGELAVEIDEPVLDRLAADVAAHGAVERAWLLQGAVRHDAAQGAACVSVRDAVEVAEGRGGASQHHFAFDPAALVAARRAGAEHSGAVTVGWAHSHPPCADCPANAACEVDTRFFSIDDIEVHTSAFPHPYMVGLVVGKVGDRPASRPGFRLYGWKEARVRERTYQVRARAARGPQEEACP